jgi:hypothetical protein
MALTIRDALLTKLPLAARRPADPAAADRQRGSSARIIRILIAVFLLAGWSHLPGGFFMVIAIASACWAIYEQYKPRAGRRGLTGWRYIAVLLIASTLATGWMTFVGDSALSPSQFYVPLSIGFVIAGAIDDGVIHGQSAEVRDAMMHAIRVPSGDDAFEAHWPFQSSADETVWAIDPARRSIRVMLPALEPVDVVVAWDDPIRSIELDRVARSWMGSNLSAIRGDRKLTIVSGRDAATTWSYTFHFSGTDKEQARHWHNTFKTWMRADLGDSQAA